MEYYLAIKRNRAPIHTATGMNLENILSKIRYTQMTIF
jgi:hypothetical protein